MRSEPASLWHNVVRRSLADWPVVLAAWLLLVCAVTCLAAGALYADLVAVGGLRQAVLAAAPADRNVLLWATLPADETGGLQAVVGPQVDRLLETTGGEVSRVGRDSWLSAQGAPGEGSGSITGVAGFERLESHATLVEGRWPQPGRTPLEATLPQSVAEALGLRVGDRIVVADRRDETHTFELTLTGLWRPSLGDPFWHGITGNETAGNGPARGPVALRFDDLVATASSRPVGVEWRVLPALDRLSLEGSQTLAREIAILPARLSAIAPKQQFTVRSTLPGVLAEVGRSALVSRGGILVLVAQFGVLAAYAILLVAGILVERRRATTALLVARGAGSRHLGAMALTEGVLLAVAALAVAPWLAIGVVAVVGASASGASAATPSDTATALGGMPLVAAGVGALGCVAGLALPSLVPGELPGRVRATIARQGRQTVAERLGVDLALVVLAAVGLWQLRLYGAPLTRNARGVLGADPLLVAAPAIGLLAGAVLATRFLPRFAELAEAILTARRGLVLPLGARQLARRPLRYTRAALLLMLASALGAFAAVYTETWSRSQADQAAYQAASDVRVVESVPPELPSWAAGSAYRGIPGVEGATPIVHQTLDVRRAVVGGDLVAFDPEHVARVLTLQPTGAAPAWPALSAALRDARPGIGLVLPRGTRRVAVTIDARLSPAPRSAVTTSAGFRGITASLVLLDADGRVQRVPGSDAAIGSGSQRIDIPLSVDVAGDERGVATPAQLLAVELLVRAPAGSTLAGTIDLVGLETSTDVSGDRWAPVVVPADAPGWGWRWSRGVDRSSYVAPLDAPSRLDFGSQGALPPVTGAPDPSITVQLWNEPRLPDTLPAIAGSRFLELAGVATGDELNVTTLGSSLPLRIAGSVTTLSPLDPARPFVIVDRATLELARFAASGDTTAAREWWLAVDDDQSEEVLAALRRTPFASTEVVGREELQQALSNDPLALGLIGTLTLGAMAAMAFAAIGFVVSAAVSTSERVGEFAILRALGLSNAQLARWLAMENALLLVVGVLAGTGLGLLLAWLVLPFATLTQTGAPPLPEAVIVVAWERLGPLYLVAAGLLSVVVVIIRRQLPQVRIGDVLRGSDE